MSPLAKYLRNHAEPEAALAERLPSFDHVICVPACAEDPRFVDGLEPALTPRVLLVVVVNGTANDPDTASANHHTLSALTSGATPIADGAWLASSSCLVIDRASEGREVPVKKAVGLARKIAADVACALFARGQLAARWIHMTDCDVVLPTDYLAASPDEGVLLTYPFRHVPGGEQRIDEAHAIYEAFLHYYVLGLRWAGSRYALHTIGSTLAADVHTYAAVRGMPRRQAAEDFYFVNKVAKLGRVVTPRCAPLQIVSRRSLRVPFGTGRSTASIAEDGGRNFYHPLVFDHLRAWLAGIDHFARTGGSPTAFALAAVPTHREVLQQALESLDAERSLAGALAAAPRDVRARANRAHEHFDAFRTRKLVHILRDGGMGELPWRQALKTAPFLEGIELTDLAPGLAGLD